MDQQRVVTVEINGLRYPIRSQLDAAYIAELAAYVDQKMSAAQRECPAGDTLKIAVLAALNIADECFRVRDEDASAPPRSARARTGELERMLDLALGLGRPTPPRRTRHRLPGPPVHSKITGVRVPCFARDGSEARLSQRSIQANRDAARCACLCNEEA